MPANFESEPLRTVPSPHALTGELGTSVLRLYLTVRAATEALCKPLKPEDYVVQSMPEASPAKWHLGHTSWFFETFLLREQLRGYELHDPEYPFLFNSYYEAAGARIARASRGMLTRPTVEQVLAYRHHVDERMEALLRGLDESRLSDLVPAILLGLHHEQQHQELLLTDLKHAFSLNPLQPAYQALPTPREGELTPHSWAAFPEGVRWLGYHGIGFSYDNERPRHRVFLEAYQLATRLVTNSEYMGFVDDGGYRRPQLWLSDGWEQVQRQGWQAPLYWQNVRNGTWRTFTLGGPRPLQPDEPVCHVNYYEADAFARWAKARLPTEAEWEIAANHLDVEGNFVESGRLHPCAATAGLDAIAQLFGDVWEWTASPYVPYPGFQPEPGAFGEYNGKFMVNQMVLRGGSCVSPRNHLRATYRNFFAPHARWQFSGIRLAKDA
ncbi:MAG TPA: ergothioneine biosynthesis protein EgtB [Myxococcales bacterium]|jgi:ergothioneine biosynthesis protein EgtB